MSPKGTSPDKHRSPMNMRKISSQIVAGISLAKDLSKQKTPDTLDSNSRQVLDDLQVKMTREQIFALKYRGIPVENDEIFKALKGFSPTGR